MASAQSHPAGAPSRPDAPSPARAASAATVPLDAHAVTAVIAWFADAGRDLPWRSPGASAWSILVSEVMLQQTPVVRVLPRWLDWMDRWPTPADLASAPTAEVLRAWDRLGYPRRALRLQQCARAIVDEHDGVVPRGEEALRALPGIGEYTAAAVTAFAHHDRAVVLDTNVRRVLARTMAGTALPPRSLTVAERRTATQVLPEEPERSVAWNQAVMELGALVCTAGAPRCEQCPLAGPACAWYSAGRQPAAEGSRRVQAFAGTDRQLRGQIMALLRTHDRATEQALLALDPGDEQRVRRCRASLVADGLAVPDGAGLRLP